jgi:1-acyl-sn-glycerol-3-phosphate acyltransferase
MFDKIKDFMQEHFQDYIDSVSDPWLTKRIESLDTNVNEYGVDPFGLDLEMVKWAAPFIQFLYRSYFRVEVQGIENVPPGRVLLIGNHSGQIPMDAAMVVAAMMLEAEPPRLVRSMVETWVPSLPILSYLFVRWGQIVGTRENCQRLLEAGQPILSFPEGVTGISKPFAKRYQLQKFGHGFLRLALSTNTPIVPVSIIGAEEQSVSLSNAKPLASLLGMPALPLTPLMPLLGPLAILPLPTKYRIRFGEALLFKGNPNAEDEQMQVQVDKVRSAIHRMLHEGLHARKHVFW